MRKGSQILSLGSSFSDTYDLNLVAVIVTSELYYRVELKKWR